MIPRVMTRDEVRRVDERAIQEFGLPGVVLMENAGRGCVDWLCELGIHGRVVVCAGKGNNGGDGSVIARHLANRGVAVRTLLFCDPSELRGDAAINFNVLVRARADFKCFAQTPTHAELAAEFSDCEWIVDGLLGTGTRGPLKEPYLTVIDAINASSARVLAIDLPSGMDCDTGLPTSAETSSCVHANYTATFVARKQGFENASSREWTGEVRVIDIGVPQAMFDSTSE